jgi:hypothetical protein
VTIVVRTLLLCAIAASVSAPMPSIAVQAAPQQPAATAAATPSQYLGLPERKEVMRQARESYGGLKGQGLTEFRFDVVPDWDAFFKAQAQGLGQDELLPALKQVHFHVVVGPDGASNISHQSDVAPPSEELATRMRQSIGGMEQVVTGFLQTWSGYAMGPPLPPVDSEYQIEDLGKNYRFTYKDGPADVVLTLGRDFAIEEMKVTSSEFSGSIHPTLLAAKTGFRLTGYEGTFKAGSNDGKMSASIEHSEVDGIQLPEKVKVVITLPAGQVLDLPLVFTNRAIKKQ